MTNNPNTCSHVWLRSHFWVVMTNDHPDAWQKGPNYGQLEWCRECGMVRVPEELRGPDLVE
jgi:hypothetical protein